MIVELGTDLGDDMSLLAGDELFWGDESCAAGRVVPKSGTNAVVLWGTVFGDWYIKSTGDFIGVFL